jgi:folate-binding protein YgfZ
MPSPLLDHHRSRPHAELTAFGPAEIVLTFGEPQAEYAAIHKAAAIFDAPHRGLLEITGKDRHAFLGNLLTNKTWDAASKTPLAAGTGKLAYLLNLKGRIVAELNLIQRGDRTLIETDARLVPMLRELFDRYLFGEQVKLTSLLDTHGVLTMFGPGAASVLADAGIDVASLSDLGSTDGVFAPSPGTPGGGWGEGRVRSTVADGPHPNPLPEYVERGPIAITVWREDRLVPSPAYHLAVRRDDAMTVWTALLDRFGATDDGRDYGRRKLRPIGWAAFNAARIEAGRPILGIDYEPAEPSMPGKKKPADADVEEATPATRGAMPIETGLFDRGVDVAKGCYLGQEIVARLHARKMVPRQIVGFRMEGDALPIAGAPVYDASGTTQLGVVTSSTMSPVLSDAAIGLVMLKKPSYEVGTKLVIAAEGAMRPAVVTKTPFVE